LLKRGQGTEKEKGETASGGGAKLSVGGRKKPACKSEGVGWEVQGKKLRSTHKRRKGALKKDRLKGVNQTIRRGKLTSFRNQGGGGGGGGREKNEAGSETWGCIGAGRKAASAPPSKGGQKKRLPKGGC